MKLKEIIALRTADYTVETTELPNRDVIVNCSTSPTSHMDIILSIKLRTNGSLQDRLLAISQIPSIVASIEY